MTVPDLTVLHVRGPDRWNDTVHITGTPAALAALRAALARAELTGAGAFTAAAADGEPYVVVVERVTAAAEWAAAALPYAAEPAAEARPDARWPWDRLGARYPGLAAGGEGEV